MITLEKAKQAWSGIPSYISRDKKLAFLRYCFHTEETQIFIEAEQELIKERKELIEKYYPSHH